MMGMGRGGGGGRAGRAAVALWVNRDIFGRKALPQWSMEDLVAFMHGLSLAVVYKCNVKLLVGSAELN